MNRNLQGFLKSVIPVSLHYKLALLKGKIVGYRTYSQFGEDKIVCALFENQNVGRYVDVGAHHPYRYSNTYLLFKKGWYGVNIDPNPDSIALFNKERPKDTNICAGVGKGGILAYFQFSDPAVNSFNATEAEKWMKKEFLTFLGTRDIQVRPLSDLVQGPVDLLCIDVEGMDLEVLKTHDWQFPPKVVVVEGKDSQSYLEDKGYDLYKECGVSYVYIHSSFKSETLNMATQY